MTTIGGPHIRRGGDARPRMRPARRSVLAALLASVLFASACASLPAGAAERRRLHSGRQERRCHLLPVAAQLTGRARRRRDQRVDTRLPHLSAFPLPGCRGRPVRGRRRADKRRGRCGAAPRPELRGRSHETVRPRERIDRAMEQGVGSSARPAPGRRIEPVHHLQPSHPGACRTPAPGYRAAGVGRAGVRPHRPRKPATPHTQPDARGIAVAAQHRHSAPHHLSGPARAATPGLRTAADPDRLRHRPAPRRGVRHSGDHRARPGRGMATR